MVHQLKICGCVTPVTALSVHYEKILAGCGSQVQVFDARSGAMETAFAGLRCINIHGFRPGPLVHESSAVCVFGGKCINIFTMSSDTSTWIDFSTSSGRSGSSTEEFEDWIWDVVWLQQGAVWTVALALAHNVVLHYDWQSGIILQRVTCKEKCLLYCARFIGSSWSDLILAAGTVFNQVVLWSVTSHNKRLASASHCAADDATDASQLVLHRLSGHQGVIFSIRYHSSLRRICSVSDDRSIRIWQLKFTTSAIGQEFGSLWNHVTFTPMLTLFGHSARVWDVVLLSDRFVSVGEDACCIVWDYKGQLLQKCKGHKGRSIWSLAASEDESFVITGGGDSSVRQWNLWREDAAHLTQTCLHVPEHIQVSSDDFTRTLALWDYDTVLLMTNAGSLLCHTLSTDTWAAAFHDAAFASYSKLALSPDRTLLAVGSIAGYVRVIARCHGSTALSVAMETSQFHEGKVCGLTWVSNTHFISTGLGGQCVLAQVTFDPDMGVITMSPVEWLELPTCKHRWVVAGCLLPGNSHVVCGDRSGSVHFYHLASEEKCVHHPGLTFPNVHGNAGVTCICYHSNTVYTAGRDGQYRCWGMKDGRWELLNSSKVFKGFDWIDHLVFTDEGLTIFGFYSSKFIVWSEPRGERLLDVECGGGHRAWDCLHGLSGFRFLFLKARQIVMVTGQQRVGQVIVKPALHGLKVWDMKHVMTYQDSTGTPVHVVCSASEDTTVGIGTLHTEKGSLLWHGRHSLHGHLSSVRALAVVDCPPASADQPHHSSSVTNSRCEHRAQIGQGDSSTDVCSTSVSCHSPSDAGENISKPTSSHQDCWHGRTLNKLVFSAGGRAQIQVWKFSLRNSHVSRSAHSERSLETNYEHIGGCFLGESRHKRAIKPWKTRYLKLDPETRIMDLAAVAASSLDSRLPHSMYLLAAVGSDGVLRLFMFEEDQPQFTLLCQSSHHNGCILQVHIHLLHTQAGVRPLLLSASTDGQIAIRDLQPVTQWLLAVVSQQPTSTSIKNVTGHEMLFSGASASGGDSAQQPADLEGRASSVTAVYDDTENSMDRLASLPLDSKHKTKTVCIGYPADVPDYSAQEDLTLEMSDEDEDSSSDEQHNKTVRRTAAPDVQYLSGEALDLMQKLLHARVGEGVGHNQRQRGTEPDGISHQQARDILEWAPSQEIKVHQSGVNSIHMKSFEGQILLATGGDDNALTVCQLILSLSSSSSSSDNEVDAVNGQPVFDVVSKTTRPDAHAAQTTGVWILSSQHILTASIDQRVNIWRLAQEKHGLQLESSRMVDIADISSMDVWQEGNAVYVGVCGEGIALLTLDPVYLDV